MARTHFAALALAAALAAGADVPLARAEAGSGSSRVVAPPAAGGNVPAPVIGYGGVLAPPKRIGLRREGPDEPAPPVPDRGSAPPPPVSGASPAPIESAPPPTPEERFQDANRALDDGRVAEAIVQLRALAQQDHAGAQTNLGNLYLTGRGVTRSPEQAASLYQKAAALGSASARFNLGRMHETGTGVARSFPDAVRLYCEASERGFARADVALAHLWIAGRARPANDDERERVLESAGAQGDPVVQDFLANPRDLDEPPAPSPKASAAPSRRLTPRR